VIGSDQEIERKRTWEKQLAWESEEERATEIELEPSCGKQQVRASEEEPVKANEPEQKQGGPQQE